jgi:hypothetical protein
MSDPAPPEGMYLGRAVQLGASAGAECRRRQTESSRDGVPHLRDQAAQRHGIARRDRSGRDAERLGFGVGQRRCPLSLCGFLWKLIHGAGLLKVPEFFRAGACPNRSPGGRTTGQLLA